MCINCNSINHKPYNNLPEFCSLSCYNQFRESNIYCSTCKEIKQEHEMCFVKGKMRNKCKSCHTRDNTINRAKKSDEHLKEVSKRTYRKRKERISSGFYTEDELIRIWCRKARTKSGLKNSRTRENLSVGVLYEKALIAKQMFPYITFNNSRLNNDHHNWASLDRIDSSKGYEDDNVIIVPLWLNSAKLNMTYKQLLDLISTIPTDYLLSI